MSDRSRRGITLGWLVLFLCSLFLQYGALANPKPVDAVHDEGLFELDGNAMNEAAPGDDWSNIYAGANGADDTRFIVDPVDSDTDKTFTGGNTKDDEPIGDWLWKQVKASQAKNDITNAFAAAYTNAQGHSIIYFGLNKWEADGDNFVGFWFVQDNVGPTGLGNPPGSPFTGEHQVGDILVLADYTNGGSLATFSIFKWVGTGGDANAAGTLDTVASGVPCTGGAGDDACGATNGSIVDSPWPFVGRDAASDGSQDNKFLPGTFFEGGIDLTANHIDNNCFSTFIAETRSSQSVDATLSDFAMGTFSFCAQPDISTQVSQSSITVGGGSVTDTAHLSGDKGPVTGTVDFFLCGPTQAAADCSTGGTNAGTGKVVNASGDAVSNAMSPTAPGYYCFRAEFHATAGTKYLDVSHTNSTTECFQVIKASPSIVTAANQTVSAGQSISDSATLSGGYNPTGTITFRAYGPNDATCANAAVFTSSPVAVNAGNGTYGPVSFTPATSGVYRWIATYSGDANNNGVAGVCNAAGETDTVNKVQPQISTAANQSVTIGQSISDSATLSGGVSPTGTITFTAYGPGTDCTAAVAYTTTVTVDNGNNTYGPVSFTPSAVGTYRWIASYSGDGNNNSATGACNDSGETDVVTKAQPTIVTGDDESVVVGSAIHDSATLSGGVTPTGTITFNLYATADCSGAPLYSTSVTVNGNGTYGPVSYTPASVGTYHWIATYSGDAKNVGAAGACGDAGENDTVTPKTPGITTTASDPVTVGGQIHDVAHLSGGQNPTGTITFKVWGPGNTTCAGAALFTDTVSVNGNGDYTSGDYTATMAGTYRWIAAYSGDTNNNPKSGLCNDSGENVVVNPASPSITTTASEDVVLGGSIHDVAHLAGGYNPTGTITFTLYGPNDAACATVIFTSVKSVNGNGDYTSGNFTPSHTGTYRWIAAYSGDTNNNPVSGACNDADESVDVTKKSPAITTTASDDVTVGGEIWDVAHLSGGAAPTGTILFELWGPGDNCDGTPIFSDTVTVNGNGDYTSAHFTTAAAGDYHWIATYSGDGDNNGAAGTCLDEGENVTVNPAQPAITTTASETVQLGGSIHDVAHLSGGFEPTGTIIFWLYGPDDATCDLGAIFTDEVKVDGNGDYTSGDFTPTKAGTYRWVAAYSGDSNNLGASGLCNDKDENVDVTKKTPSISTTLSDGETSGTHLTFPIGTSVHDSAALSGASSDAGGTVTYTVYSDNECSSKFADAGVASVTNGVVGDSDPVTFNATGTYYWQAVYSGDANNEGATSSCLDETVTIVPNEVTINTLLSGQGHEGSEITVQIDNTVTDSATLTGETADAGGTVTYTVYRDNECTDVFADGGTVTVTNGNVPDSDPVLFDEAGTFYWQADYSGDKNNTAATSACTDEVVHVVVPSINIVKSVDDADHIVGQGQLLTYTLELSVFNGPVTQSVVSDPLPADQEFISASNGGVYDPTTHTINWDLGTLQSGDPIMTLTYDVKVADDAQAPGEEPNTATFDTKETPPDSDDELVKVPDVNIVKTNGDEDGVVGHGQTVTYTIDVTVTQGPVTDAVVTDTLPAGQTYVDGSQSSSPSATFELSADGRTLTWSWESLAQGAHIEYDVTIDGDAPAGSQTNTAEVCVSELTNCKPSDSKVDVPELPIVKSFTGNTEGEVGGIPIANIADTLTYTLAYDLTGGPVHNGVITDTIPEGLTYIAGTASDNDEFTFVAYDSATRTLTWHADVVSKDGSVTYQVSVDDDAFTLIQPLVNVATIDSDETDKDTDTKNVGVQTVEEVTSPPTLPPTDSFDSGDQAPSNPGFGLTLTLLAIAGIGLLAGYLVPGPRRPRRETVRRR